MLSKTASHALWICFIALLLSVFLWLHPGSMPRLGNGRDAPAPAQTLTPSMPSSGLTAQVAIPLSPEIQPASAPVAAGQGSEDMKRAKNFKLFPHRGQDLAKYKPVEVTATGYYAGLESTGKKPGHPEYGLTFSGLKVMRDDQAFSTIAADPSVFPLGTVMYIPGYGYGIVADTGSAIKGNRIDLYFETKDQVYKEWGKKTLDVFVVKEGEGKIDEVRWNQLKSELLF